MSCFCEKLATFNGPIGAPEACQECRLSGVPIYQPALKSSVKNNFNIRHHPTKHVLIYVSRFDGSEYDDTGCIYPVPAQVAPPPPMVNIHSTCGDLLEALAPAPDAYERLADLEQWSLTLNANLKILGMPYNGQISWGAHMTCKKGRFDIDGQGKTLSEAINNLWPKFLDVQAKFKV